MTELHSLKSCIHKSGMALLLLLLLPVSVSLAQSPIIDPWQHINRPIYQFNKVFDGLFIRPVALGYNKFVPARAKIGVRNFFNNLDDVNVLVNDLLQLKMKQAFSDSGRLLLNSTVGIGGFFDVAAEIGMYKHYEDFGQTLGYWGVGDGGYLMLPVLGSSTLRDAVGYIPDTFFNPIGLVTDNKSQAAFYALDMVDTRVSYFAAETMIRGDEYVFIRNAYMQRREYLVQDGQVQDEFDDY